MSLNFMHMLNNRTINSKLPLGKILYFEKKPIVNRQITIVFFLGMLIGFTIGMTVFSSKEVILIPPSEDPITPDESNYITEEILD